MAFTHPEILDYLYQDKDEQKELESLINGLVNDLDVNYILIDSKQKKIINLYRKNEFCLLFSENQEHQISSENCMISLNKAFGRCLKSGEPEYFTCLMASNYCLYPITLLGKIIGILILGPFNKPLCTTPKKLQSLLKQHNKSEQQFYDFRTKTISDEQAIFEKSSQIASILKYYFINNLIKDIITYQQNALDDLITTDITNEEFYGKIIKNVLFSAFADNILLFQANISNENNCVLDCVYSSNDNIENEKYNKLCNEIFSKEKLLIITDKEDLDKLLGENNYKGSQMAAVTFNTNKNQALFLCYFFETEKKIFIKNEINYLNQISLFYFLIIERSIKVSGQKKIFTEISVSQKELRDNIAEMGRVISSALDLEQLLKLILEFAIKITKSNAGSIYLIENKVLTSHAAIGLKNIETKGAILPQLRKSIVGWEKDRGITTQHSPFNAVSLEASHDEQEFKTYLGLPILYKDNSMGVLNIYSSEKKKFTSAQIELLYVFVKHAALAINNIQIFHQEKQRAKEATNLYKAMRAIGQSVEIEDLLGLSAYHLTQIAEVDRILIFLKDEDKRNYKIRKTYGLTVDQEEFFSFVHIPLSGENAPDKSFWDGLEQGRPLLLTSPPGNCKPIQRLFEIFPTNSCVIVPLLIKDNLLGLIYLDDSQITQYFTDSQMKMIMSIALQLAMAIQRILLIKQLEENFHHLKALYQVFTAVTGTLSQEKLVKLIVEKTLQLLRINSSALLLKSPETDDYSLAYYKGIPESLQNVDLLMNIARYSLKKKVPSVFYVNEDLKWREIRDLFAGSGLAGVLVTPLIYKKEVDGIILAFSPTEYQFSDQHVRLMISFANQIGIAMDNIRLYGIIKNKVHELASLFEVAKAITSTLQFEKVLEEIVENVCKVMKVDACSIMLLKENKQHLQVISAKGLGAHHFKRNIALEKGTAGMAVKTGRPMLLRDKSDTAGKYSFPKSVLKDGLRTILSVPLHARGKIIGLINTYMKEIYSHSQAEIDLLQTLANQAAIAMENARLYKEQTDIANIIQKNLIPQEKIKFPGIDVGYKYIPSEELSGDYYDLIPTSEHTFSLAIADVAGKGTQAAIYTARAKYILKSLAIAKISPEHILEMTNKIMYAETEKEKFVSLFLAEANLKTMELTFCSAGHEPPVYYDSRNRKSKLLFSDGLLVGIEPDVTYKKKKITIAEGDIIVLYTDGISEARNPSGEFFGSNRLLEIVKDNTELSAQNLTNKIYNTVKKFTMRNINDDFTLLLVKF